MTDNEIIKALEYCSNPDNTCKKCDLYVAGGFDGCKCASKLKLEVVDLIKRKNAKIKSFEGKIVIQNGLIDRQKAEIERLQKSIELMKGAKCVYSYDGETLEYCTSSPCPISKTVDQIKAEAVNEVVKQLEAEVESSDKYIREYEDTEKQRYWNIGLRHALKVVKRMVGDSSDKKATSKEG